MDVTGAHSGPSQVNLLLLYNGFKSCQHEKPIVPNGERYQFTYSEIGSRPFFNSRLLIDFFFSDILSVRIF
jgi:hypothetical protein